MRTSFQGFNFNYKCQNELNILTKEIEDYKFDSNNDAPFIIDCGAHIGAASLYFKSLYPNARIIAFEPNPLTYYYLLKNLYNNKLNQEVTAINAALSNEENFVPMYGVATGQTLGNSIMTSWGKTTAVEHSLIVKTLLLSNFINEPVDLLKIDIEGAELIVLNEVADKLPLVKRIVMEIHLTNDTNHNLEYITQLLKYYNFEVNTGKPLDIASFIIDQEKSWALENSATTVLLTAFNKNYASSL